MSAQSIYEFALLGSIIRFSDGAPRPPDRHRRKLSAWENNNSGGRLIRKQAERRIGNTVIGASITLHAGDYGSGGVVVLRVHQMGWMAPAHGIEVPRCDCCQAITSK